MKKLFLLAMPFAVLVACNNASTPETKTTAAETEAKAGPQYFGEKITADGAKPTDSLKNMMGDQKEMTCKLTGKIEAVCQKKGCWMELKNADNSTIRVTFKDYAFFMPKDCSGKTAIVEGIAKVDETSVADLKEYAKDNGDKQEAIDAITEPKKELVFEAKGVILQ